MYFLAIETSCDDTSIAIFRNEQLLSIKTKDQVVHQNSGGVIPEIASREHSNNIDFLIEEALKEADISFTDLKAIVVTYGPGLINSLQIGVIVAKTISMIYNIPLYAINHLEGHIFSPFISQPTDIIPSEAIILLVSGGHTMLLYKKNFHFKIISNTRDDSVGEAFDKVSRILGLGYPGGKIIDEIYQTKALEYKKDQKVPLYKVPLANSIEFSYSGLKSNVLKSSKENKFSKDAIAIGFMDVAVKQLIMKTKAVLNQSSSKNLFIVGGVSANSLLRKSFDDENLNVFIPELKFTTDNAAMIGTAFYFKYINGQIEPSSLDLDAVPKLGVGEVYDK